jgi:hypothetical protein
MDRECGGELIWTPQIIGPSFLDYENYKRQILSERTTLGDFWPKIFEEEGGEEDMLRMDDDRDRDIYFLYKETWDGKEVSDLENSHLVNILLKLERDVYKNKTSFELFVLDHSSDKLLRPIYDITELAKMEPRAWLEETPIWKSLNAELEKRNLKEYYEVVSAREAAAREKKGE